MDIFHDDQPPIGFTMGLAMDLAAMNRYARLTEAEKEEIMNRREMPNPRLRCSGLLMKYDSFQRTGKPNGNACESRHSHILFPSFACLTL